MSADSDNPFAAPETGNPQSGSGMSFAWHLVVLQCVWAVAVLVNLPVPVMFGRSIVETPATSGMLTGILIVYLGGAAVALRKSELMWVICIGSAATAISQFFPIAHILVGMISIMATRWLTTGRLIPGDSVPAEFGDAAHVVLATGLTGAGLLLVSFLAGIFIVSAFRLLLPRQVKVNRPAGAVRIIAPRQRS